MKICRLDYGSFIEKLTDKLYGCELQWKDVRGDGHSSNVPIVWIDDYIVFFLNKMRKLLDDEIEVYDDDN